MIAGMSAALPNRCTGMMAFVLAVIRRAASAGSIKSVRGSTSQNTGVAPAMRIAVTVATAVLETVITSSSPPTPSARKAIAKASVPLPTPMAWPCSPRKPAHAFFERLHSRSEIRLPDRKTRSMAVNISCRISSYCWR